MDSFTQWLVSLHLVPTQKKLKGSPEFLEFLGTRRMDTYEDLYPMIREEQFGDLRYRYPLDTDGYYVAVLRAQPQGMAEAVHYGAVYWPKKGATDAVRHPEYLCLSPSFVSNDGEYRQRLIWYPIFQQTYDRLEKELSDLEEAILQTVDSGELALDGQVYPDTVARTYLESLDDHRILVKALVASLVVIAPDRCWEMLQAHTHPAAIEFYRWTRERWGEKIEVIYKNINAKPHNAAVGFIRGTLPEEDIRIECGQKTYPLTQRETLQVGDVNFAPWREVFIHRLCSDLVLNTVAPGFSMYNGWTYLEGIDAGFFDNKKMQVRYEDSEIAAHATDQLEEARNTAEKGTSPEFVGFDQEVYDAAVYAESYLLLSELALVSTSEYTGRTVESWSKVSKKSAETHCTHKLYNFIYDEEVMQELAFGLAYSARAMHDRLGLVHTDLHGNNATIYVLCDEPTRAKRFREERVHWAYVAGDGEDETYLVPYRGFVPCIIDFSQTLIGTKQKSRLTKEFGPGYAELFYDNQRRRVMRALATHAPQVFRDNAAVLQARVEEDLDSVINALSAVDYLMIATSLIRMHGTHPEAPKMEFLSRMEVAAYEALHQALALLVAGKSVPETAGRQVMSAVFEKFLYRNTDRKGLTLTGLYMVTAGKMLYSGDRYQDFPPWAKFSEILAREDHPPIKEIHYRGYDDFKQRMDDEETRNAIQARFRTRVHPPRLARGH